MQAAGLLHRRRGYYAAVIALVAAGLGGVVTGVVLLGDSWLTLLMAAALALVLTQCAYLGHDGAHRQVFATARANEWTGRVFACLMTGLSLLVVAGQAQPAPPGAEPARHRRRRGVEGALVPRRRRSLAHRRACLARAPPGLVVLPLLALEGFNLHADSVRSLVRGGPRRGRLRDVALVVTHWTLYLGGLLLVLSPGKAAAFVAVHLALFGVHLGGAFAPNHTGMPVVPRDAKLDFLSRQVLMSRNVTGGWFVDLLMGGLNHQVEHHLFPSMPRVNLRRARPLVRAHCEQQGVTYTETSLVAAFRAVLTHLRTVGSRAPTRSAARSRSSLRG
ncbi:fatty acid desaturase [Angustibacter aerolatus]|uniref:Fatty acid desaturase n=1 Tax=Angustibacter aerolatus TaxID=1162965 RepID=A0ABQ6JBM5_9ACTN|nr:fatty acid desaturase [Angustibacter aerolatus]GMA84849.1 fatty acid desaturase [Angustibacter aerolatus]